MTPREKSRAAYALGVGLVAHADPVEGPIEAWLELAARVDGTVTDTDAVRAAVDDLVGRGLLEPSPGKGKVWRRREAYRRRARSSQ